MWLGAVQDCALCAGGVVLCCLQMAVCLCLLCAMGGTAASVQACCMCSAQAGFRVGF